MPDPVFNTPTVVAPTLPPVTPQTAYSTANMAQTVTAPLAKPDLSDPFGTRAFYMNSHEIQAAKAQVQKTLEDINASKQGLRTTTTAFQNQNDNAQGGTGASINLIGRQVGRATELTNNTLSALSENQMANQAYLDTLTQDANANYQIAEQQRQQVQDLIRQTGGKAKITYADSFETSIQKAQKYLDKKAKDDKDSEYKDSLKQMALKMGIKTSGTKGELERRIKKVNASAVSDAKRSSDLAYKTSVAQYNKMLQSLSTPSYDPSSAYSNSSTTSGDTQGINYSPFRSIYE